MLMYLVNDLLFCVLFAQSQVNGNLNVIDMFKRLVITLIFFIV